MKFGRFIAEDHEYYGMVEGPGLRVIEGDLFSEYVFTGQVLPVDSVQLLAPVKPTKIIGVGLNYKKVATAKGVPFPEVPILFLKPPSSIIGPSEPIIVPEVVTQPIFEVEIAVVIGKKTKNISLDSAIQSIFGYTLCNDVTAKDHMPKGQPWARGKSFDTFTPLGPWLVTELEPEAIDLSLHVNGIQKQNDTTSDMIFTIRQLVVFISSIMTLEPGDVILTGTPQGGGAFTKGDVIELFSSQIGRMNNPTQ